MIRIEISDEQKKELETIRSTGSSANAERALMVLLNADGESPPAIAERLKRHPHTVRDWLRRYQERGVSGLSRRCSPGRPAQLREEVADLIEEALQKSPSAFKYPVSLWTTALLADWLQRFQSIKTSQDTIERALKSRGYRYRRTTKTMPTHAPSKEEKRKAIGAMINEILEAINNPHCTVLALDESHFSTEPYILNGWQKKLWPPGDPHSEEARESHAVWLFESGDRQILLEERRAG